LPRWCAAVAAVLLTAVLASPAVGATGAVGHWPLSEGTGASVADTSGSGNPGALSGGVAWSSGRSGPALSFDGTDGQVTVADSAALEPATALTVSAWVNSPASPGGYRYIVAKGANGCTTASYGLYTGPNGGLQFYVAMHGGATWTPSADAGTTVWNGRWHLAVGTFDGSTLRLYVDGAEVGSPVDDSGSLVYGLPNSNAFLIGNYPDCTERGFSGLIDDVTVWNRALSPAEVRAMMPGGGSSSTGSGGAGSSSGSGPSGGSGSSGADSAANGGGPAAISGPALPWLSHLRWSQARPVVGPRGAPGGAHAAGLTITYDDSRASRVTLTLERLVPGVSVRRRCVAPPRRRLAHLRRCLRPIVVERLVHTDRPGRNTVRLSPVHGRPLAPGRYVVILSPRRQGRLGSAITVAFSVRRGG
jgi:hypothetical protein